jgi:hypothetical protein
MKEVFLAENSINRLQAARACKKRLDVCGALCYWSDI